MSSASLPVLFDHFTENVFGDRYLYQINRDAFNKLGANAVFAQEFASRLFEENTLQIFVGTDSGLLIRYIAKRGMPSGSRYLFIELPDVIETLKKEGILNLLGDQGACVTLDQWLNQAQEFKIKEYFYIDGVAIWQSVAAREAHLQDYMEIVWRIDADLTQLRWRSMAALGSEAFTYCQIANLTENIIPASTLKKTFNGKTALLLAGGPSLDEVLPWLQQNRHRVVVLAVSRIARRLNEIGINPDIVFSVDPSKLSFDVSKEMLEYDERTLLIHAYHAQPMLVGQWKGPNFYLGDLLPWKSKLNPVLIPYPGPTVTNTALAVAHEMGFNRIILAGVDCCFSQEGYTHAKGSDEHSVGPRFELSAMTVETNGGRLANTTPDLNHAAKILAIQAMQLTQRGCQIINPCANAAKIEFIDHTSLADIELDDETLNVWEIIRQKAPPLSAQSLRTYYRKVLKELRRALSQTKAIRSLSIKGLHANTHFYSAADNLHAKKHKNRLDKIEKKLHHRYKKFGKLTKKLGVRDFIKITRPFEDDALNADTAKKLGTLYYEAYRDGAQRLMTMIDQAMQRIEARLEESESNPNVDLMFKRWLKDQHYGRAGLWRQRNPLLPLTPAQQKTLNRLEALYRQSLTETNSAHLKRAQRQSSLAAAQKRGRQLQKNRQIDELKNLLLGLEHYPDPEASLEYRYLISAYIAELEGYPQQAMDFLHPIIENQNSALIEDALLQVLSICLEAEQHEDAGFALECLSLISPIYKPHFAEILNLLGQPIQAIDIYNDYLKEFPEQIYAQLKLARLYFDLDLPDVAKMMLEHIMQQAPDNESAQTLARLIQQKEGIQNTEA